MIIRNLVGNVVQGSTGIPYNEGDQVSLFCDATGGKLNLNAILTFANWWHRWFIGRTGTSHMKQILLIARSLKLIMIYYGILNLIRVAFLMFSLLEIYISKWINQRFPSGPLWFLGNFSLASWSSGQNQAVKAMLYSKLAFYTVNFIIFSTVLRLIKCKSILLLVYALLPKF